jgi:hypothetical protein
MDKGSDATEALHYLGEGSHGNARAPSRFARANAIPVTGLSNYSSQIAAKHADFKGTAWHHASAGEGLAPTGRGTRDAPLDAGAVCV